jgi:phosphinothricin acetyltransferase
MVARAEGEVIGWAALSPVSSRVVYRGVAEVSIYVAEAVRGCGVGAS